MLHEIVFPALDDSCDAVYHNHLENIGETNEFLFSKMDKDHDKCVSREEFSSVMDVWFKNDGKAADTEAADTEKTYETFPMEITRKSFFSHLKEGFEKTDEWEKRVAAATPEKDERSGKLTVFIIPSKILYYKTFHFLTDSIYIYYTGLRTLSPFHSCTLSSHPTECTCTVM